MSKTLIPIPPNYTVNTARAFGAYFMLLGTTYKNTTTKKIVTQKNPPHLKRSQLSTCNHHNWQFPCTKQQIHHEKSKTKSNNLMRSKKEKKKLTSAEIMVCLSNGPLRTLLTININQSTNKPDLDQTTITKNLFKKSKLITN